MAAFDQSKREAEEAISRGELHKARAILRSAVGRSGYDQDLYEMYGRVLLHTGQHVEAGKWLFLSARRAVAYEDAIDAYLARYGKHGGISLYRTFPTAAKLGGPNNYPPPLNEELKALGVPEDAPPALAHTFLVPGSRLTSALSGIGCGGCFLFALASVVVGAVTILNWLKIQVAGWFQ